MQLGLAPLFAQLERTPDAPCVLATVIGTQGSSYRKSGAMMLITQAEGSIGLVSGGCLESDLREHAKVVFGDGRTRFVRYDLSTDDAALWGLGLGCGGAIDIMLELAGPATGFAGLSDVHHFWQSNRFCWLVKTITEAASGAVQVCAQDHELGATAHALLGATRNRRRAARDASTLLIPVLPPPRLTICGAGPDAVPLAALAVTSGWQVTVVDHRMALTGAERFARGVVAVCSPVVSVDGVACVADTDALVVMAHHLEHDAAYVSAGMAGSARYIGLLGPRARRDDVLARANVKLDARLYGPAGLDIGADLPETIALSILAQAQAVVHGSAGGSLA
ncbi:MAG: XdhC family protein [Gammaproteobacteria bacterium]